MVGGWNLLHLADFDSLLAVIRDNRPPKIDDVADIVTTVLGGDKRARCEDIAGILWASFKFEHTFDSKPAAIIYGVHSPLWIVVDADDDPSYSNPSDGKVSVKVDA